VLHKANTWIDPQENRWKEGHAFEYLTAIMLDDEKKKQVKDGRAMSAPMIKQLPLSFRRGHKSDVRTQFAALCYKVRNDKVRFLLVTTRRTGRWIIPKGWPMEGKTPAHTAQQEAWEEAGVVGKSKDTCLGVFAYEKVREDEDDFSCIAMVYPVKVKRREAKYPEVGQRQAKWVGRKKAMQMVTEPELARIIRDFDPIRMG